MIGRPHLFEEPASEPRPLTARQQFALDVLRRSPDGLTSDELGARWHEERMRLGERGHDRDVRCEFCAQTGNELGASLRSRGLVRKRGNRYWQALDGVAAGPSIEPGDLPAGY